LIIKNLTLFIGQSNMKMKFYCLTHFGIN